MSNNNQKKIGVLIDHLHAGGVQKVAIEQTRALNELGYHAELLILRSQPKTEAFFDLVKDLPVVYLDQRLPRWLRFSFRIWPFSFLSWFHFSYPLLMLFVVRKKEWAVLLSHNTTTSFTACSLSVCKNIPYVWVVHDPLRAVINGVYAQRFSGWLIKVLRSIAKKLDRLLLRKSDWTLVFGYTYLSYLQNLAADKEKIQLILQGKEADVDFNKCKKDYFVTASSWKKVKKLELLISYFADLEAVRLKIIGSFVNHDYQQKIESLIAKNKLQDRVELVTDYLTDQQMWEYYQQARGLILVKGEPGFGRTPWEAAACGCPSIVSADTGVVYWLEKGSEVLVYNVGQSEKIKSYITKLAKDLTLSVKIGRAAWHKVEKYTWKYHVSLFADLLDIYLDNETDD